MSEPKETSTPGLALAGSVLLATLTATLTYHTTAKSEREKALTDQKKEAYIGFVSAIDKDRVSREKWSCDLEKDKLCALQLEYQVQGGASLRRIAVYGDAHVVNAIANYSRALGRLTEPCAKTWALDLAMFAEMRRSVLGAQQVSDQDLAELALPCKAPLPVSQ